MLKIQNRQEAGYCYLPAKTTQQTGRRPERSEESPAISDLPMKNNKPTFFIPFFCISRKRLQIPHLYQAPLSSLRIKAYF